MAELAYLVIREGSKWTDVFRLTPGRTVTIGRAPTSQIVIKDERCSRAHAEVFMTEGEWTLRDLDSRNGTWIGERRVTGDNILSSGDVIVIAHAQLAFVHNLSDAFPESHTALMTPSEEHEDTMAGMASDESGVLSFDEPTTITHRQDQTRFLKKSTLEEQGTTTRVGRAAAKLCRIAFELANQPDAVSVANLALEGAFEETKVDAGAVLMLPKNYDGEPNGQDLRIVVSRTDRYPSYHRISGFLANTVLREGEGVLARNIGDDSALGSRDSKGVIHSTSVICAPIRQDGTVVGLIHLYSTETEQAPDPEDLEFSLAIADNVALALKNLAKQEELAQNLDRSKTELQELRQQLWVESEIIGQSPAMDAVRDAISQAAPTRATILIRGESGVGKELVARAVHFNSERATGPLICLNCAALSETLLESELFGHEKGAFTGATERKIGKFEAADSGTLVLDEIGEMSPAIQAKFLRALEGHPFERVGGSAAIQVDVRVIASTNRDLEQAVSDGLFRRDLYFRLHVVQIMVPPLRVRKGDVLLLAEHFLRRFSEETSRRITGFTARAEDHLQNYDWPGNVRELKNAIERAVVLTRNTQLDVTDLPFSNLGVPVNLTSQPGIDDTPVYEAIPLSEIEKRHIQATLDDTGWNKSRAASILGIERSTLDRKINRYELSEKNNG